MSMILLIRLAKWIGSNRRTHFHHFSNHLEWNSSFQGSILYSLC